MAAEAARTGPISRSEAEIYTVILAGLALVIAALIFNWLFTTLVLLALGLSYPYARYTRDNIGYLTVISVFRDSRGYMECHIPRYGLNSTPAAWTAAVQITHEGLTQQFPPCLSVPPQLPRASTAYRCSSCFR
jgi:hypothetical protein